MFRLSLYNDSDAIEPVSLDEAKAQVKLTPGEVHPDDELLEDILIPAVRERAEMATNRQLREVTWDLLFDEFPRCGWIELPKPPLIEVVSVSYVDGDGVTQTWAADQYAVYAPTGQKPPRGRIALAYSTSWPSPRAVMNAVTVRFRAGYGTLNGLPLPVNQPALPMLLKEGMLLDLSTLHTQRENVITGTIVQTLPSGSDHIYRSFKSWPTQQWAAA